jgi:hypothetical protein
MFGDDGNDDKADMLNDAGLDKQSRYYYVDFIHKAGYLLEVYDHVQFINSFRPQTTTTTAIFFFHKFFASFQKYDKQVRVYVVQSVKQLKVNSVCLRVSCMQG